MSICEYSWWTCLFTVITVGQCSVRPWTCTGLNLVFYQHINTFLTSKSFSVRHRPALNTHALCDSCHVRVSLVNELIITTSGSTHLVGPPILHPLSTAHHFYLSYPPLTLPHLHPQSSISNLKTCVFLRHKPSRGTLELLWKFGDIRPSSSRVMNGHRQTKQTQRLMYW